MHISEVKSLRSELTGTTSVIQVLRSKLDAAKRSKSLVEEQRDKYKSDLEEQKSLSTSAKIDLERRLARETDKVKVLEDLVGKMEQEIERSTMSVKSGSDRHSLDTTRDDVDDDISSEAASPRTKHVVPGSPLKTLFAEMAHMSEVDDTDDEEFSTTLEPTSPELASTVPNNINVAQVLQSLRQVETIERGIQTDFPKTVPDIRVFSPTPPLTAAPIKVEDIELVDQATQTDVPTATQRVLTETQSVQTDMQTDTDDIAHPMRTERLTMTSPILRPGNSIRRSSHSVRWQDDKSVQTEIEQVKSVEMAIQTDPFMIAKILKPAIKSPSNGEIDVRHERIKSYDGPSRRDSGGSTTTGRTVKRFDGSRGSMYFGKSTSSGPVHGPNGVTHERRTSSTQAPLLHPAPNPKNVSTSRSSGDLRRGRQPHPTWKARLYPNNAPRPPSGIQLHTPTTGLISPGGTTISNVRPPLPIPKRSSSKFHVVLPIVRDRSQEETLHEVTEEADEDRAHNSEDEEERTRREVNAFLARPPRKTVRQIRSAGNIRPGSPSDPVPPTPDRYTRESSFTSHTPSSNPSNPVAELSQKSYSTPRRQPKRLVRLLTPGQETPVSNLSPTTLYSPTSEEMSVVDEIARCMVGEYMYKYVRRRRKGSFTWRLSPARSPAANDEMEDGVRHKRWVWLQPYEKYPRPLE
jgi:hypothetical protein